MFKNRFALGVLVGLLSLGLFTAGVALATTKAVRYDFREGISIGKATGTGDLITAVIVKQVDNLNPGAAATNALVVTTTTVTGAALGDLCLIAPVQDDAALDDMTLTCFVESADTVKVQWHADVTGATPAATTDFRIFLLRF